MRFALAFLAGWALSGAAAGAETNYGQLPLTPLTGGATTLKDVRGEQATVLITLAFDCPIAAGYASDLAAMARASGAKGVKFVGVCPTQDSPETLKRLAEQFKLGFPLFRDPDARTADALEAKVTPEAFVFDRELRLTYRGRIDDTYSARLKRNVATTRFDLKDAIEATLAGKPVGEPVTTAVGCPIERPTAAAATGAVTYHRDVAPILARRCAVCHRPGEVGPFPLLSYQHARKWAGDIKEYTQSRQMPPWLPRGGVAMKDERKLTDKEIATLAAWVDGGTPEGDPAAAAAPASAEPDGWRAGPPDLILKASDGFQVGPTGRDVFRVFVIPTGLTEDKWVVGYDVKPGNSRVVHHTLHYFDTTGTARKLEEKAKKSADPLAADRGPGYSVGMGVGFFPPGSKAGERPKFGGLGGYAPGQGPQFVPDGAGWYLTSPADFLLQVHYHRTGKTENDRTQVGLYFAKKPVVQPWQTLIVPGMKPFERIPANAARHVSRGAMFLHDDAILYNVLPHMHLLGKSVKVTLTPPGGEPRTIIDIPEWDYNWQETYWFAEPIRAAAGSQVEIEAVFDNSATNPNNPSTPPKDVHQGEETTNEMLYAFLGMTSQSTPWKMVRFRPTPPK
jgi:cytochrome c553